MSVYTSFSAWNPGVGTILNECSIHRMSSCAGQRLSPKNMQTNNHTPIHIWIIALKTR